jgi:outer membrane protein OmpA-like peptidoglycan-associated protein
MFTNRSEESNWLTIADMMTALMVIFMFIAINYIIQVIEHTFVQEDIYNKLEQTFAEDLENHTIELGPDGAIRFNIDKGQKLFETGQPYPTETFKNLLSDFIPRYWAVLTSDTTYFDFIKEIRIEGHADAIPYYKPTDYIKTPEKSYLNNLELSQQRAANVLKYIREQPIYKDADQKEKARMDFLFTSIGFSYARTLNENGNYVYLDSIQVTDNQKSRRVEFRIVTSNEKLAKKLINENGD